jgi:hypothetical protein
MKEVKAVKAALMRHLRTLLVRRYHVESILF